MENKPSIIQFPRTGASDIGYLGIVENGSHIPFEIQRVFWAYFTPDSVVRGRHAHHNTEMILIAVAGRIVVTTEMPNKTVEVFTLEKPNEGLYIPKYCWHTMQYSHNAVQLVLASSKYAESDYIRSYEAFKEL
jgi:dTDP-4-dehydrorhamnose 3,5-epimerase-like enzyme